MVTAQKRTENLQNVPISIEVLDNAKLEQLHVVSLDDYVKYSPSITYSRAEGQGGNGQPGTLAHLHARRRQRRRMRTTPARSRASAPTSTSSR